MATKFTFNNQLIELPGSRSRFISGVNNPPIALSFGNVLLVDAGSGVDYGSGAGISGTLASGNDAIYTADSLQDFRNAVGGGIIWDIAERLFQPNGPGGGNGISTLIYARAAATVSAEATIAYVGGGGNGGTAVLQLKNEGTVGNGVEGDQTLATTVATPYTVTAVGGDGDIHTLQIDEGAGLITVAEFAKTASETTEALLATELAAATQNGYTAVSDGADIHVTARQSVGLEDSTDWNTFGTEAYAVTGTATGTAGTFAGAVDGILLTKGYAIAMSAGVDDPAKFLIKIFRGSYRGKDVNGFDWDGIAEVDTAPRLIATSPEFDNIAELHTWMETDFSFGTEFKLKSKTVVGTGAVDTADLTANSGNNLFSGGTTVYDTTHLDTVLTNVQDRDYSQVLCDDYADNAQSTNNGKILAHLVDGDTVGDKRMVVGGGEDVSKFAEGITNSSISTAIFYNNDRVRIVHGGPIQNSTLSSEGFISRTSLHKAASVVGNRAGLAPQIPQTFKAIKQDGERHSLNLKEQKQGLRKGVFMTIADGPFFRVLQGVTSIQNNDFLINPDGSTHSDQLRGMIAQVNREITVNATESLLKNPDGTNRNTLSQSDVKSFVETYLKGKTATATIDNLIIKFRNVVVVLDNDAYKVTYEVVFNTEITKLFFTGTVVLG